MSGSGQGNWGAPPGGGGPFGPPGGGGPFGPPGGGPFGPPGGGAPPGGGYGAPPGGGYGAPPGGGYGAPPGGGYGAPPGGGYGAPPGGGYGAPPGGQFPPAGPPGYGPPAAWGAPPPPPNKNRTLLIIGAIAGVAVLCTVCAVAGYFHNKQTQETYGALTAACQGRPVAGARNYVPGPTVHRVVGAEQSSNGEWRIANGRIPNNQLAQGINDAEAVLCFGNETRVNVGSCDFYSTRMGVRVPGSQRTYQRTQQAVPVRVVAATTGMMITTGNIVGPAPLQCNQNVGRLSSSTFQGSSVSATQVGTWLQSVLSTGGMGMVPM